MWVICWSFLTPKLKTRYVDDTPTSEVIPVTIRYIRTTQQTLTLKLQGQGHGCDQRTKSYSQPSILPMRFLFIPHQSDQQFLRYSYYEIWPWNSQGKGHEGGQRSRPNIIPSIQLMHFLFVLHQSDPPFLRYGQNNVWPCKINTSNFFKEKLPKYYFLTYLCQHLNRS